MRISTESVISRTKQRLGLMDTTLQDAYLELLIQEGARHLDTQNSYIISCQVVDVDCARAPLPDQYSQIICLQPLSPDTCTGCDDTTCNCTCGTYYFIDRGVLTDFCDQGGRGCYGGNAYDVQNGFLVLPSNTTATQIKIWYRGLNTDDDGLMVIDDFQERGLSAYAAYQFASSGQNYRSYAPGQVALWQRESTAQINKIRGKASQDDHRQHKAIFARIAQALIANPWNAYNLNI